MRSVFSYNCLYTNQHNPLNHSHAWLKITLKIKLNDSKNYPCSFNFSTRNNIFLKCSFFFFFVFSHFTGKFHYFGIQLGDFKFTNITSLGLVYGYRLIWCVRRATNCFKLSRLYKLTRYYAQKEHRLVWFFSFVLSDSQFLL